MQSAKIQLQVYTEIGKDLSLLKSSGHFALLYTAFLSIYESIGLALHKENLKVFTSQIIDHLWSNQFSFTNLDKLKESSLTMSEKISKVSPQKKANFSVNLGKSRDFTFLSDFSYVQGPGTFSKEKRISKLPTSPGPGEYNVKEDLVKSRSPGAFISKSKKNLKNLEESPGPGSYSPLYHFRSR